MRKQYWDEGEEGGEEGGEERKGRTVCVCGSKYVYYFDTVFTVFLFLIFYVSIFVAGI